MGNKFRNHSTPLDNQNGHGIEAKFNRQLGEQIRYFSQKIERMIADAEPKRT